MICFLSLVKCHRKPSTVGLCILYFDANIQDLAIKLGYKSNSYQATQSNCDFRTCKFLHLNIYYLFEVRHTSLYRS